MSFDGDIDAMPSGRHVSEIRTKFRHLRAPDEPAKTFSLPEGTQLHCGREVDVPAEEVHVPRVTVKLTAPMTKRQVGTRPGPGSVHAVTVMCFCACCD